MNNIIDIFDKIIVDGVEIDLQSLSLIRGTLNVGSQKDVNVEYIFKDKTKIPSDMFKNLKQLKYAYFPKAGNIKTIGERAFANSNLTYIDKLSDINYIGAQAFSYTKLTYVYNGDSPDSIAANAWSYIGTLTDDFKTILKRKYPYIDFGAEKENEGYDPWEIYDETPIINVTSNIINATSNGGEYEIEYTITNPLVGITISAVSNVDWITNFNYNTSGKIKFTINPQEANSQQRSGNITLTYGSVNKTITVNQAAGETSGQTSNPIINLTSNNIIEVGNISSQQTITYNISNPISGASISASSNVTWINGFNTSISGQITFNVDAQENNALERTGIITLTYPNAQNVTITVNQAAGETSGTEDEGEIINFNGQPSKEGFVTTALGDGKITYNGIYYKIGVKINSSGSVTFTSDDDYNMTLILSLSKAGRNISINGQRYDVGGTESSPVENYYKMNPIRINKNVEYTITKGASESTLMLIILKRIN